MSNLVFYGAGDDLLEVEGVCLVDGCAVTREEFLVPSSGQELMLMLVFEDLSMGVVASYREVTGDIWALAPVILAEGMGLPWEVTLEAGGTAGNNYPEYTMVLTVHDVPDGIQVIGPEYDGG